MGEVLHIINADVEAPEGLQRARVWLTPGYPRLAAPGIALTLMVDRWNDNGRYELRVVPDILRQVPVPVLVQEFWLLVRSVRLDVLGYPDRALVELAYAPTPTLH